MQSGAATALGLNGAAVPLSVEAEKNGGHGAEAVLSDGTVVLRPVKEQQMTSRKKLATPRPAHLL